MQGALCDLEYLLKMRAVCWAQSKDMEEKIYPMAIDTPALKSLEQFCFEVPPHSPVALTEEFGAEQLYNFQGDTVRIDGHCPSCNRASTFTVKFHHIVPGERRARVATRVAHDQMSLTCVRDEAHKIYFYFRITGTLVQKIGQFPSLADISNDEVSQYRKGMEKIDANEFHKAIGLAAHGVGVGSFVYLRRVFERLIYRRFEEFKEAEGWADEQFYAVRMEDKIALLQDHLPDFLVQNRKIYSILSVGVHELDEKTCLGWFDAMKHSIIIILEDDKKKKEELERRQAFSNAIAGFSA